MAKEETTEPKTRKKPERKQYDTPKDRFAGLAKDRTLKAEAAIKIIANCSDPVNYEYTPQQVALIVAKLEKAVQHVKDRFADPKKPKAGDAFEL